MRAAAVIGWGLVMLSGTAVWAWQGSAPAPTKAATALYDRVFDAYAAGDRMAVITQLATLEDCKRIQPALQDSTKTLLTEHPPNTPGPEWRRDKAAFVLELANDLAQCAPRNFWSLLFAGRTYVLGRPTLLGVNPDDDAFELKWHMIAVALLLRERASDAADIYLDTVERRYLTSPAAKAAHTSLDPRFVLMRGMNAEARAAPRGTGIVTMTTGVKGETDLSQQGLSTKSSMVTSTVVGLPPNLNATAKLLELATALEAVAPEALVRLAAVRLRMGQPAEALAAVERANVPAADRPLAYWAALWRGRILDGLNRPADAERAFQQALDVWPTGQSAGVGLALVRFKQNRRAEAAEASAHVQAMPPGSPDPWWIYTEGDARFLAGWLGDLRKMLR